MITADIRFDDNNMVEKLRKKVPQAVVRALNKSILQTRTEISTQVRQTYNVRKADFDDSLRIRKAIGNNFFASLISYGKRIALPKFKASWSKKNAGASVEVIKGQTRMLKHTFISTMKSGHEGVYIRRGIKRLPIRELKGPTPGQMMVARKIWTVVETMITDFFVKHLDHEVDYEVKKANAGST